MARRTFAQAVTDTASLHTRLTNYFASKGAITDEAALSACQSLADLAELLKELEARVAALEGP